MLFSLFLVICIFAQGCSLKMQPTGQKTMILNSFIRFFASTTLKTFILDGFWAKTQWKHNKTHGFAIFSVISFVNSIVSSTVSSIVSSFVSSIVSSFVSSIVSSIVSSFVSSIVSSFVSSIVSSFVSSFVSCCVPPLPPARPRTSYHACVAVWIVYSATRV